MTTGSYELEFDMGEYFAARGAELSEPAFLGTVVFAFLFYPRLGLVPTAFVVAGLNAAVGTCLIFFTERVGPQDRRLHHRLLACQTVLLAAAAVGLTFSAQISEFGIGLYLKTQ